jgi:cytochrome c5
LTPPDWGFNHLFEGNDRFMKTTVRNLISAGLICGAAIATTTGAWAADATAGAAIYSTKCRTCHGADGTGNPGIAKAMKVEFKPLATESDAELKTATTAGVGKMKPVAGVAGADLDNLVAAIHALKK